MVLIENQGGEYSKNRLTTFMLATCTRKDKKTVASPGAQGMPRYAAPIVFILGWEESRNLLALPAASPRGAETARDSLAPRDRVMDQEASCRAMTAASVKLASDETHSIEH